MNAQRDALAYAATLDQTRKSGPDFLTDDLIEQTMYQLDYGCGSVSLALRRTLNKLETEIRQTYALAPEVAADDDLRWPVWVERMIEQRRDDAAREWHEAAKRIMEAAEQLESAE